jgi:hypothetical protein
MPREFERDKAPALPTVAPWHRDSIDVPATVVLVGAAATIGLRSLADVPDWEQKAVALLHKNEAIQRLGAIGLALVVGSVIWQRFAANPLPNQRLRFAYAAAYGAGATLAGALLLLPVHGAVIRSFIHGTVPLCITGATFVLTAVAGYATAFGKLAPAARSLKPYPLQVERQRESYDFTLGAFHPDDEMGAREGREEWLVWPELGALCNLLVFGAIGSGKTSQVCDPLVQQAMGKFPEAPDKQMSMLIIDYKGNQAARYYAWAKEMNRHQRFFVIRPDILRDEHGVPLIPEEQYVSFSPLEGHGNTDLVAIELQEALESTKDRPSPDYFQNVQREFLQHALRLLNARNAQVDLADVHSFAASEEVRKALLNSQAQSQRGVQDAVKYFRDDFGKLSSEDQSNLLRGLAAQLAMLASETMQSAFCAGRGGKKQRRQLGSWSQELLDEPTVVVFSCPSSEYSESLSRILGLLTLKSFQKAMKARPNSSFTGNKTRPVMLLADEAHGILNKGLGDFLAVSRESRIMSVLLTQSLGQIDPTYRDLLEENCRTQITREVGQFTADHMESSLGTVAELQESASFSESQRVPDARQQSHHGAAGGGTSTGMGHSYTVRDRPRFKATDLRHMPPFHGVAHVFDGERQLMSCLFKTTPWYRLPYYLLDVRKHRDLTCSPGRLHKYKKTKGGTLQCSTCQKALTKAWEIRDYESVLPAIRRLTRKTSAPRSGAAS